MKGSEGLTGQFAVRGMQVGVAHARGHDLDQDTAGHNSGHGNFLDMKRLAEGVDDRCFHCLHGELLKMRGPDPEAARADELLHRDLADRCAGLLGQFHR